MKFIEQYHYPFKDLCETGKQIVYTRDITKSNIDQYFNSLINILKDGIETEEVQNMIIYVIFEDNIKLKLSIFDFIINIMFWQVFVYVGEPISSINLFFFEDITRNSIKKYLDNLFIDRYRKHMNFQDMNIMINSVLDKFRQFRHFQLYLMNTLNLKDTIDLMNQYDEFRDAIHFNIDGIPLEDVKNKGMEAARTQIKYIKNSDHCLRDSFRTGETISPKQYKEVFVNIGTKPDGNGSVFPYAIKNSFINGGLDNPESVVIDSSVGRVAQILQKNNVGDSGAFARRLEINNQDTFLHPDPNFICNSQHFQKVTIDSEIKLNMYNMRYYRENIKGLEKCLNAKRDKHLIGKTLYFRSPMTCASAAKGQGICYRCYGDLAYTNQEINIGQIASEALSSIYTQILLSAKHLLESNIIKLNWNSEFFDFFEVCYNTIGLNKNADLKNWSIVINEDDIEDMFEDIDDDSILGDIYGYYINTIILRDNNGIEIENNTTGMDNIYLAPEFYEFICSGSKSIDYIETEDGKLSYVINLNKLNQKDFAALFVVDVKNNELSQTMDNINKLIDTSKVIRKFDRNELLEEFTNTNIKGGIILNAVHFEVLLMNQIRDLFDDTEMPDWSLPNVQYKLVRLTEALSNNRSITKRLETSVITRTLVDPKNRFLNKPSITDLFFMEQPQEYINKDFVSDEYVPKSDIEKNTISPISFKNKKVRTNRKKDKK